MLRALRAVPRINNVLWWDEGDIDIGDKFHPTIQQGLAESKIGIVLLSNYSFTSDYILTHELPYLIQHAEAGDLKLGCLYLTSMAEAAFVREIEIDGRMRTVNLKEYVGAHAPNKPLDTLDKGARAQVYKHLADWVAAVLDVPDDRPDRQRSELGITLHARGDRWEHSFWLPPATPLQRPELDVPRPDDLFAYPRDMIDGEDLFRLLFGSDPQKSGNILGAAFGVSPPVDPTLSALRVRLMTNDERLWALPWGKIAYHGRRLAEAGWTVELHDTSGSGVPEYPLHTCYFPGKVVLLGEIDKAPRDFPNDLLHELDQHSFPHPFDQTRMITPESERPPIVIITSNEERRLPDAFLRRCIFYRIKLTPELVEAAVESMARADSDGGGTGFPHLDDDARAAARQRFWDIRNLPEIEKKPSTAELLTWLCILSAQRVSADHLRNTALKALPGIGILIKSHDDFERLG